jgi:glycosyltransferase involved in cell wall biosynthesis
MVAYIFPPLGGGGVLRTLKFARYLPDFGWSPMVLTCRDGGGLPLDESLEGDIPERLSVERVTDPMGRFRRRREPGSGSKPGKGTPLRRAAARMMRFFPGDYPAWTLKVLGTGKSLIRRRDFDLVYSTSSPPDNHLIARFISRRKGIPWVADFRDPWTWNYLYEKPWPTRSLERWMERSVIREADAVVTVSEPLSEGYRGLLPPSQMDKVVTITNGFDPNDFPKQRSESTADDKIKVVYCGNFDRRHRPTRFLEALEILLKDRPLLRRRLTVRFMGAFPPEDCQFVGEKGLEEVVSIDGYRPYRECRSATAGADILLFLIYSGPGAEINLSGKLFQYLALRKPILGIVPDGAAREILKRSGLARLAEPSDEYGIAATLGDMIDDLQDSKRKPEANEDLIRNFEFPVLAGSLAEIFDKVTGGWR